jgi:hypothetical protein
VNKIDGQYLNLGYWFLGLVVLTIAGFYHSYFGIWSLSIPGIIHIHAFLMSIWISMLIIQPILIKKKKFFWHRKIGQLSYFIVPMIVVAAYAMIRYGYDNTIAFLQTDVQAGKSTPTSDEIIREARIIMFLPVLYFLWFTVFYILAIINRRKPMAHAQYMIATAFTLLGPTVDRILYRVSASPEIAGVIPLESFAFGLILLLLLLLLWYNYGKGYSRKTLSICLAIYVIGQITYFTLPRTDLYQSLAGLIMF